MQNRSDSRLGSTTRHTAAKLIAASKTSPPAAADDRGTEVKVKLGPKKAGEVSSSLFGSDSVPPPAKLLSKKVISGAVAKSDPISPGKVLGSLPSSHSAPMSYVPGVNVTGVMGLYRNWLMSVSVVPESTVAEVCKAPPLSQIPTSWLSTSPSKPLSNAPRAVTVIVEFTVNWKPNVNGPLAKDSPVVLPKVTATVSAA